MTPPDPVGNKAAWPTEKTLRGQGLVEILCGIQHHFDLTLDVAICWDYSGNVHAQVTRDILSPRGASFV